MADHTTQPYGGVGRERIVATSWAVLFTAALAVLIVVGSRTLQHFDAALVGYTFAVLFAVFGITYRYSMWLQRPPTRKYWYRGWQYFFRPQFLARNISQWFRGVTTDFALNRFIYRRDPTRWAAHILIMWGCLLAFAITFPLVFGWIHFETVPGQIDHYRTYVFGFPTQSFPIESLMAFVIFHGLVWSAFAVIAGVMLAMRRRMRDHDAAALQRFGEDLLPLILLFAISVTGLLLTASYTFMKGYGYDFLGLLHAITVIAWLLWMPFGKFFHIFQRPAQLGVSFYKEVGALEAMARCARCNAEYAPLIQVNDLIQIERELGYRYELVPGLEPAPLTRPTATLSPLTRGEGRSNSSFTRGEGRSMDSVLSPQSSALHYQQICPSCRRSMMAVAQGRLWQKTNLGAEFDPSEYASPVKQ